MSGLAAGTTPGEAVNVVAERAGTPPHSQVKLSGIVPPLADFFHQRPETGLDLRAGLYPGDTVVLTHGEETAAAPGPQGGTGKTQLAVAFTQALWGARAVDALIWVSATSRESIITGFAQAARTVGAADESWPAEAAAVRFIGWLTHTMRPWALILDDLASLADLENLWPAGPAGQVVITTRLPEAVFRSWTGSPQPGSPQPGSPQPGSSQPGSGQPGSGQPGSGQRGSGQPGSCRNPQNAAGPRIAPVGGFSRREVLAYLSARLTDYPDQRAEALDLGEDLDGLPLALAQAAAVMSVSRLSCREYRSRLSERREHMTGVRVDGVSPAVLATWSLAAECAHELPPAGVAWPALALAAMLDPHGIPRAVLTTPAGCGYVTGQPSVADAADQALVRAAVTNLARAGLVSIDPASLACAYRSAGQLREAIPAYERILADRERVQGPDHADTSAARANLAAACQQAGRLGDAIHHYEQALADSERMLGPGDPETLTIRSSLATAHFADGRLTEAIPLLQRTLADSERYLGPDHPLTRTVRDNLEAAARTLRAGNEGANGSRDRDPAKAGNEQSVRTRLTSRGLDTESIQLATISAY
jgi:tetratricopeptide (TPR) repeat protein